MHTCSFSILADTAVHVLILASTSIMMRLKQKLMVPELSEVLQGTDTLRADCGCLCANSEALALVLPPPYFTSCLTPIRT